MVALPLSHPFLEREGPLSFAELAGEPLILYPRVPRPSYADQVISIFRDRGLEPNIAHEARELQTAIGLVAAEVGICIVPTSVHACAGTTWSTANSSNKHHVTDHHEPPGQYRSRELAVMSRVIIEAYREWGWKVPEGLDT